MRTPQACDGQQTVCLNPATGDVVGYSRVNTPEEAREALRRARVAQPAWAALPLAERVRYILRLRDYLVDHTDAVSMIVSQEVGKTRIEALATEILPSALATDYYAKNAWRFLKPRKVRNGSLLFLNKRSRIYRVPFGVIGIIAPWNYPLGIPMHEMVPALLAGNTVIFKAAPETQMVGRTIEAMIQSAGLPEGVFAHLNLPGAVAGRILLEPDHHVNKLFFTGSVAVGKILMAQAAETLTPVSLELGGNDPMLVCPDANLERAVNGAIWAGLQNSGQSCGGVERIYVHQNVYEPFIQRLKQRVETLRQGADARHNVDIGAMCTERQIKIIQRQVADALTKGAAVLAQVRIDSAHANANFYPVTVLVNVDHSMDLMRQETFGPVLGVMKVQDMEQAVALANDSSLGLTGSVWSNDTAAALRLGRRIQAGVITINDHLLTHGMAETPWGGFKESGIGRSHGALGFGEMTQPQVVTTELLPFARRNLFWHPYDASLYEGLKGALRLLHGHGFGERWRGLLRFIRLIPRLFKD
ncbi:MAG: aldehyde dehydrogenase family protein [Gammaproteobacteria bacterium]|nr:aldehyde dehydrogenase family protein [Gammaproteobacteria bacterium]MCP5195458.1 aldehyde dehydrogenase family protein [Gammaproteobacteria bacterium]